MSRPGLDVSGLDRVLRVDPDARTADVQGMTTYEHLVDATLPHGLMPTVVPQLKTITLGGAVTGLGIESSSFREGLPHEAVREVEVLTGAGEIVVATPTEHADLFRAFPNSYGTLGYALRLVVDLLPVRPYVHLRHVRFGRPAELAAAVGEIVASGQWAGEPVEFLDGTVFSASECYLTLGSFVDSAPYTSDYTGQQIFYRSIQRRREDYLTVRDYLWRWDTDWFWCSRAFGAQNPWIRRVWPKRYLRSDVYWKMIALENRYHVAARLDRARGKLPRERLIQDVEIPLERTGRLPRLVPARGAGAAGLGLPAAGCARPGRPARRRPARRPGRSTRWRPARRTSTSASGRPCRSGRAGPTATSTGTSSGSWPSTAGTSPSTPTRTTTRSSSARSTAATGTRRSSSATTPTAGCWTSTRRR